MKKYTTKLKNIFEKKGDGQKNLILEINGKVRKNCPVPIFCIWEKRDFYKKKYWNFVIFDLKTTRILRFNLHILAKIWY